MLNPLTELEKLAAAAGKASGVQKYGQAALAAATQAGQWVASTAYNAGLAYGTSHPAQAQVAAKIAPTVRSVTEGAGTVTRALGLTSPQAVAKLAASVIVPTTEAGELLSASINRAVGASGVIPGAPATIKQAVSSIAKTLSGNPIQMGITAVKDEGPGALSKAGGTLWGGALAASASLSKNPMLLGILSLGAGALGMKTMSDADKAKALADADALRLQQLQDQANQDAEAMKQLESMRQTDRATYEQNMLDLAGAYAKGMQTPDQSMLDLLFGRSGDSGSQGQPEPIYIPEVSSTGVDASGLPSGGAGGVPASNAIIPGTANDDVFTGGADVQLRATAAKVGAQNAFAKWVVYGLSFAVAAAALAYSDKRWHWSGELKGKLQNMTRKRVSFLPR